MGIFGTQSWKFQKSRVAALEYMKRGRSVHHPPSWSRSWLCSYGGGDSAWAIASPPLHGRLVLGTTHRVSLSELVLGSEVDVQDVWDFGVQAAARSLASMF